LHNFTIVIHVMRKRNLHSIVSGSGLFERCSKVFNQYFVQMWESVDVVYKYCFVFNEIKTPLAAIIVYGIKLWSCVICPLFSPWSKY